MTFIFLEMFKALFHLDLDDDSDYRPATRNAIQPRGKGYNEIKAERDAQYARECERNEIGNQSLRYQAAAANEGRRRGVRWNNDEWDQVVQTADQFAERDVKRRLRR